MRTLFIAFFLLVGSFNAYNQSSSIQDFYQQYKSKETASEEEKIKWLDKLVPKEIRKSELKTLLENPQNVQFIVLDQADVQKKDIDHLRTNAVEDKLELIIRANDQGERLDLFARAEEGYVRQVLYLVEEEEEFVFLLLSGKWTFRDFIGNRKREAY